MWLKDKEQLTKRRDPQKPVSIVFPYSYSNMEALLVYLSMAFFQDPIFQYEAVGGTDDEIKGGMLLEKVIRLHSIKNKVPLNLHTMFRDSLAYGIGCAFPWWREIWGAKPVRREFVTQSELGEETQRTYEMASSILFEGNALENIDPYMLLPDPSVASNEFQKGEFIGWVQRTNYMRLAELEDQGDQGLFNVKYLKLKQYKRSILSLDQSERKERYGGSFDLHRSLNYTVHPVDVIHMYIRLIPREWGLAERSTPEVWYFQLAADDIVIKAERADRAHGLFSVFMCSPEFDGYDITPIGRMEVLYGLQHVLDFLFNSHISNVKKAVNDMLVVDPYLVNIDDLKDPSPGKLIRLRRPAWGRGVDKVVQQLAVQDITRLNISDAAFVTQWMDRISGADQPLSGTQRQSGPERLTSAEFEGTRSSAMSRLQHLAQIIGMQAMQDIGYQFAYNTQEFMTEDVWVKLMGHYSDELKQFFPNTKSIKVSPYDIAIENELIPRDGSIPGGNFIDSWIDMFKIIAPDPELRQNFDIVKIFMFIAQQTGAKNIEEFKRQISQAQTQVMSDQDVANQVQAGNMIPATPNAGTPEAPEGPTATYALPMTSRKMGWRTKGI
jgi:hypothetical protein